MLLSNFSRLLNAKLLLLGQPKSHCRLKRFKWLLPKLAKCELKFLQREFVIRTHIPWVDLIQKVYFRLSWDMKVILGKFHAQNTVKTPDNGQSWKH